MNSQQTSFLIDSLTAGTTSAVTGVTLTPDPTTVQTLYIPLITGLLAPLVKEIIISLREARKRKKQAKQDKECKPE